MRYLNIFSLHFQTVFQHRARSFVWFLIALFNPLFMILLWNGAAAQNGKITNDWTLTSLSTYYLFLIIGGSLLVAHVEEDVAEVDIRDGRLVKYLLKPVSYYWTKFFEEAPYRIIQGFYGIVVLGAIFFFIQRFELPTVSFMWLFTTTIILILAYFISFTFKMIIGFLAFWFTDIWGIFELVHIAILTLAGFVMPLSLFPHWLMQLSYVLPFSYMIYFPILALQGKLLPNDTWNIITFQVAWLIALTIVYKLFWKRGIKQFTGVGQ